MTAPIIVTDADTLRQIVREELAALLTGQPAAAQPEPVRYLSVAEFAAERKCADALIYAAIHTGELFSLRNGRSYIIAEQARPGRSMTRPDWLARIEDMATRWAARRRYRAACALGGE